MNSKEFLMSVRMLAASVKKHEASILMQQFSPVDMSTEIPEDCVLVVPPESFKEACEIHKVTLTEIEGVLWSKVRETMFLSPVYGGNGKSYLLPITYFRPFKPEVPYSF